MSPYFDTLQPPSEPVLLDLRYSLDQLHRSLVKLNAACGLLFYLDGMDTPTQDPVVNEVAADITHKIALLRQAISGLELHAVEMLQDRQRSASLMMSDRARAEIAAYRQYETTLSDDEALWPLCKMMHEHPGQSLQRMLYLRERHGLRPLHLE